MTEPEIVEVCDLISFRGKTQYCCYDYTVELCRDNSTTNGITARP